jgi:hypothetical protein
MSVFSALFKYFLSNHPISKNGNKQKHSCHQVEIILTSIYELEIQSMDIIIRHPRIYAIYFIKKHIFPKNYCEVISKRILIIF